MSTIGQLLSAGAIIAILIGFRLFVDRLVRRIRPRPGEGRGQCEASGCFRDCGSGGTANVHATPEDYSSTRSNGNAT